MTVFRMYKNYCYKDDNYDWLDFVDELPDCLLKNSGFSEILEKYEFLKENDEEIITDFYELISSELCSWDFIKQNIKLEEHDLYKEILLLSTRIFKEIISKYVITDEVIQPNYQVNTFTLQPFWFEKTELFEDEATSDVGNENDFAANFSSINTSDKNLESFTFFSSSIFKKICSWKQRKIIQNHKVKTSNVSIIQNGNYFDPAIYHLLNNQPELLQTLDWRIFEEMLADILKRFHYNVELTKPTKDGGIDIIAISQDQNFGSHKYLLQAKRYTDSVQVSPVRELLFLHDEYKATKSCLATTSVFTKGAKDLAEKHIWKLELKDHVGILSWIKKVLELEKKTKR